jgi:hypothetical protein
MGDVGVLLETIFRRSLTLCTYLTGFRTCKIAEPPQTITFQARGLQTEKHLQKKVSLQ